MYSVQYITQLLQYLQDCNYICEFPKEKLAIAAPLKTAPRPGSEMSIVPDLLWLMGLFRTV